MKKKIMSIFLIVCIILILLSGYFILQNGVSYKSKIKDVNDIETIEFQIQKEQFNIVNQYCTKSNKNSSNPFIFYKEFLVIELNTNNNFNTENFINSNFLEPCTDTSGIKNTLVELSEKNNEWMKEIIGDNTNWFNTNCQFEDKHIKSSVNLYFVSTNSSRIYIILDQRCI